MDTQEKIEKTLESLNGIKRAEANPFLFAKIKSGLNVKGAGKSPVSRTVFAAALAAIAVIVINVAVWTSYAGAVKQQTNGNEDITSFAKEYFNSNSTYNY